jgi:hypothetical protein
MRQKGHRLYTLYTKIQSLKALKAIPIECACSTIWLVRIKKWSFISLKALHQRKPRPPEGFYFVLVESFMTCRWMDYFYGQKAIMTGLRVTPQEDSGIYGQFE